MYLINDFMIYFTCKSNNFVLISVADSAIGTTCGPQAAWDINLVGTFTRLFVCEMVLHLWGGTRGK